MAVLLSLRPYYSTFRFSLPIRLRSRSSSPKSKSKLKSARMAVVNSMTTSNDNERKLPILLFDVMDTVVRDPFYHDVPAFFRMSFKELIESKHPTSWIEFEEGRINETELARNFFKDRRPIDLEGLKNCMRRGYSYVEGVEELLRALKQNGYEMHAFTNYPIWYEMIEDKLKLSAYLSWTFCSCINGKRKPDPTFYLEVLKHLNVDPARCVFIDDRMRNVEAAIDAGIVGLQFKNADLLHRDLYLLGIDLSANQDNKNQDQQLGH